MSGPKPPLHRRVLDLAEASPKLRRVRRWGARRRDTVAAAMVDAATGLHGGKPYIQLDYPPTVDNAPRYGHSRPIHARLAAIVAGHEDAYRESLALVTSYRGDLEAIAWRDEDPREPSWDNLYLPGLDGAALYAFVRARAPKRYVEVGSGNSTKFAARAKRDGGLATRIVSIDPFPRAEVDELCNEVIRRPFELVSLDLFGDLEPGDVVFFDGSHRVFMNSDTTAFFLDVLPELAAGVLVGIHDVFLPSDYPPQIAPRWYSEQYLLAAMLLGGAAWMRPVLAAYACRDEPLVRALGEIWRGEAPSPAQEDGVAFWLEIAEAGDAVTEPAAASDGR